MTDYKDKALQLLLQAEQTRSKRKKALLLTEAQVYATLATIPKPVTMRQGVLVTESTKPKTIVVLAYDFITGDRYVQRLLNSGYFKDDIVLVTNRNPDQIRGLWAKEVHAYEPFRIDVDLLEQAKLTLRDEDSKWFDVGR